MGEVSAKSQVDYAPSASGIHRHVTRRRIVLLAVLLVGASALWWAPAAWFRAQLLYWQSRCATYRAPPQTVVAMSPVVNEGFIFFSSPSVVPKAWERFYTLLSPPGFSSRGTAFLHERRRPSGAAVLVAVDLSNRLEGNLHIRVFQTGTALRLPVQVQDEVWPSHWNDESVVTAVYAGQPDPTDPTHFTIEFRSGDSTGIIDGWVREDRVLLERREPTTQPLPASRE